MPELVTLVNLWRVTGSCLLVALGIFGMLILLRLFDDRRTDRRARRQNEMTAALVVHLAQPLKDLRPVLLRHRGEYSVLAEAAARLLRLQKGKAHERLLQAFTDVGLYAWLRERLERGAARQRIQAIALLAHWPAAETTELLLRAMRGRHPTVALAALETLAATGNAAFLPPILDFVRSRDELAEKVLYDIFRNYAGTATAELGQLVQAADAAPPLRVAAAMAIAEAAGTEPVQRYLLPLCEHPEPRLRALAFAALKRVSAALPAPLLAAAAADPDWRVRQQVAGLIVNQTPVAADRLFKLLGDENWLVALATAQSLRYLGEGGRRLLTMFANTHSLAGDRAKKILAEGAQ